MPASVVHGPTQIECNPALKYHAVTPPGGPAPVVVTKATYIMVGVMIAASFCMNCTITILTVLLPDLAVEFNVSNSIIAWVTIGPMVASAMLSPAAGKFGDIFGLKEDLGVRVCRHDHDLQAGRLEAIIALRGSLPRAPCTAP